MRVTAISEDTHTESENLSLEWTCVYFLVCVWYNRIIDMCEWNQKIQMRKKEESQTGKS